MFKECLEKVVFVSRPYDNAIRVLIFVLIKDLNFDCIGIAVWRTLFKKSKWFCTERLLQLTVCSYYVTKKFQNESTRYSCLNFKELLTGNRRHIWSLSDCNGTRSHNHFVQERRINYLDKLLQFAKLAKWLSVRLQTKWLWVWQVNKNISRNSTNALIFLCGCSREIWPVLFYFRYKKRSWLLFLITSKISKCYKSMKADEWGLWARVYSI